MEKLNVESLSRSARKEKFKELFLNEKTIEWTNKDFAQQLGVSVRTIQGWKKELKQERAEMERVYYSFNTIPPEFANVFRSFYKGAFSKVRAMEHLINRSKGSLSQEDIEYLIDKLSALRETSPPCRNYFHDYLPKISL